MNKKVLNPYNFVPFQGQAQAKRIEATRKGIKNHGARHDIVGGLSGEITLNMRTVTPLIHGVSQHEVSTLANNTSLTGVNPSAKWLHPYIRNHCHAISANSIRGMVSSICEVISNAPPRVLENKAYTVRQAVKGVNTGRQAYAVGAGVLIYNKGEDKIDIKPIGITHVLGLKVEKNIPLHWQKVFTTDDGVLLSLGEVLAIRCKKPIYKSAESSHNKVTFSIDSLTVTDTPSHFSSPSTGANLYALPLDCQLDKTTLFDRKICRVVRDGTVSCTQLSGSQPLPIVRRTSEKTSAFGFTGNEKGQFRAKTLPIENSVVEKYSKLLVDSAQGKNLKSSKGALNVEALHGRIVMFDVSPESNAPIVTRVYHSQIWRESPEKGENAFDFLPINEQPFSSLRSEISAAEALFGVMSSDKHDGANGRVNALASRVSFYDAISEDNVEIGNANFKQLPRMGSPQLPCPSMYFHTPLESSVKSAAHNTFIKKQQINAKVHRMNGAKRYLRFTPQPFPQADSSDKDRLWISPVEKTNFTSTIRFTHISKAELHLLIRALAPSKDYVHQLGMGKNLGFGQLKLALEQCRIVNQDRYSQQGLLSTEKYSETFTATQVEQWLKTSDELVDPTQCQHLININKDMTEAPFEVRFPVDIAKDNSARKPTPEFTIFSWFVENEKKGKNRGQMLPLSYHQGLLPLDSK